MVSMSGVMDNTIFFPGTGEMSDTGTMANASPITQTNPPATIIPPWPGGGSGTSSSNTLNSVAAASPREWQISNIAAIGTVVPIVYGIDQIGARYLGGVDQGNTTFLSIMWAESCVGVQALCNNNGDAITAATGITIRHYDGSQTTPDTRLASAYQAKGKPFTDTLSGICYTVLEITSTANLDPQGIIATVKGFRVFDPRDQTQSLNNPATWKWSDNAALCLADFLSSKTHGYGKEVDWESVKEAADYCDELLGSVGNQQRRRTLNWAITERMKTMQLIETLRTYAGCQVVLENSKLRLCPDRVVPCPDHVLTASDIVSVPRLRRRGTTDKPTVVRMVYTNTDNSPYKQDDAYDPDPVDDGWENIDLIESTVNLPGINNKSAARREARERRLKLMLGDITLTVAVKDIGVNVKAGHVVSIPHPAFPDGKLFRVNNTPSLTGPARYQIECCEYQPQMYCDEVFPEPEYPATTLPDPTQPPSVENLNVVERLIQIGGVWTSALHVTWSTPEWAYLLEYVVEISQGGVVLDMSTVIISSHLSAPVVEGLNYVIRVRTKSRTFLSGWVTTSITAIGKYLPPSDVERFTEVLDVNGTVHLAWTPAHDIDPLTYEVRRIADPGNFSDANALWQAATVVAVTLTTRASIMLQPPSPWLYMVKAMDSVGNYSLNPAVVQLVVQLDDDSRFVDSWPMAITTKTNATAWTVLADPVEKITSDRGEPIGYGHADADDATGTFSDLATLPLALPHDAGVSEAVSQIYDVGAVVGGTWSATAMITDHDDNAAQFSIELSNNAADWEQFPSVGRFPAPDGGRVTVSASRAARFARLRLTTTGSFTLTEQPSMMLAAIPRTESGNLLVGAAGIFTVKTTGRYKGFIGDNPVDLEYLGDENYFPERDSINIAEDGTVRFDVYLRDQYGERVTGRVRWTFRGV